MMQKRPNAQYLSQIPAAKVKHNSYVSNEFLLNTLDRAGFLLVLLTDVLGVNGTSIEAWNSLTLCIKETMF
jgi:hypothetical protein